jgi:hypothetical protein
MDTAAVFKQPFWNPRRVVLAELLVFNIMMMLLMKGFQQHPYVSSVILIIDVFGWNIGILAWCKADSRMRGYQLHPKFPLAVVLFGVFAFVYYLFRSRGFLGALAGLGYAVLFVFIADAAAIFLGLILAVLLLIVQGSDAR